MPSQKKRKRTKKQPVEEKTAKYVPFADPNDGQMYAKAEKMLGNRRMLVKCADKKDRMAIIPGKFKGRRHWVGVGGFVLLNMREYQDDKADVIYVYNEQEVKKLDRKGELDDFKEEDKEEQHDGPIFVSDSDNEDHPCCENEDCFADSPSQGLSEAEFEIDIDDL